PVQGRSGDHGVDRFGENWLVRLVSIAVGPTTFTRLPYCEFLSERETNARAAIELPTEARPWEPSRNWLMGLEFGAHGPNIADAAATVGTTAAARSRRDCKGGGIGGPRRRTRPSH